MKKITILIIAFLLFTLSLFSQTEEEIQHLNRPENFRAPIASYDRNSVTISDVQAYVWSYGCSPTAMAMLVAYYDRHGFSNIYTGPTNSGVAPLTNASYGSGYGGSSGQSPICASRNGLDGRTINGHCDDYFYSYGSSNDPYYGNWTEHGYGDCIADYTGTSQKNNWDKNDGATSFYSDIGPADNLPVIDFTACESYSTPKRDGAHGLKLFYEARGYPVDTCFNQRIYGWNSINEGYTWDNYVSEINQNRPVIVQTTGHSLLGIGYNTTGQKMYVLDTWDHNVHELTWGGVYPHPTVTLTHKFMTVVYPVGTVGIEDYIVINSGIYNFIPNTNITYYAQFIDELPDDQILEWNWEINLYHANGIYTYGEETTYGLDTTQWSFYADELPLNINWTRHVDGSINGELILTALDTSGEIHQVVKGIQVGIAPDSPVISSAYQLDNSIVLELASSGATEYEIYYGTNSGGPYNGTGAVEGNSPIEFGIYDPITITNLPLDNQYYFVVIGVNSFGSSIYSDELSITPATTSGTLSNDEVWSHKIITNNSITVPLGISLTISDNVEINLLDGSELIIEDGANIVFGNNVTFSTPEGQTKGKLRINGSDPISCINLQFSNCDLHTNNTTTTIHESNFTNSYLEHLNESLILYNTDFEQSHVNADNRTGGSYYVYIEDCSIQNSDSYGVFISSYPNFTVRNNNISNNAGAALHLYTNVNGCIENNYVNNNGVGINLHNTEAEIIGYNNIQSNEAYGLVAVNYSNWSLVGINDYPCQIIANNFGDNAEIYFNYTSIPDEVTFNKIFDSDYESEFIHCHFNLFHSTIDVKNNYWGNDGQMGGNSRIPTADNLYPFAAYNYSPVWNPGIPKGGVQT